MVPMIPRALFFVAHSSSGQVNHKEPKCGARPAHPEPLAHAAFLARLFVIVHHPYQCRLCHVAGYRRRDDQNDHHTGQADANGNQYARYLWWNLFYVELSTRRKVFPIEAASSPANAPAGGQREDDAKDP
jgi:hypothetical protein